MHCNALQCTVLYLVTRNHGCQRESPKMSKHILQLSTYKILVIRIKHKCDWFDADLKLQWLELFSLKMIKEGTFCDVDWFSPLICNTCQGQQCQGHFHHHHCKTQRPMADYGKIPMKFLFFFKSFLKASDLLYDCLIATSSEWISRPKYAEKVEKYHFCRTFWDSYMCYTFCSTMYFIPESGSL